MSNQIIINNWGYDGTCLSYKEKYYIEDDRLYNKHDTSWLRHLRDKTWFTEKEEKDFLEMFYIITMRRHGKLF